MKKEQKQILSHGVSYFFVQFLIKVMGLVSFPIIARLLTVEAYGVLALANTTLLLIIAIGKLGIGAAIIARWPSYSPKAGLFYRSSMLAVSVIAILVLLPYSAFIELADFFCGFPLWRLYLVLAGVAFWRILFTVHSSWLRATARVQKHNVLNLINVIGGSIAVIGSLVIFKPAVLVIFVSRFIFEGIICAFAVVKELFSFRKVKPIISIDVMKDIAIYGSPLIWLELSTIIMNFADRYQIGLFMDTNSVGMYSAAYNIAQYSQQLLAQPIALAIFPIYTRMYKESGQEDTSRFLGKILTYYYVLAVFILFFVGINANDIMTILASNKYSSASHIIPIVLCGNLLQGVVPILAAGLYLGKRTKILGKVTVCCAIFNIFLNMFLIKIFGYLGAAVSTFITFVIFIIIVRAFSNKVLPIRIDWIKMLWILLFALIASFVFLVDLKFGAVLSLLISGILFFIVFFGLVLIVEKGIRNYLVQIINNQIEKITR